MKLRRRAFATTVAIILVGLLGMAMLALTNLFAAEARRTADLRGEAQLRQLLLAGAAVACAQSRDWNAAPNASVTDIPIPAALSAVTLQIRIVPVSAQGTDVVIIARQDKRSACQRLHYRFAGNRWILSSAVLQ